MTILAIIMVVLIVINLFMILGLAKMIMSAEEKFESMMAILRGKQAQYDRLIARQIRSAEAMKAKYEAKLKEITNSKPTEGDHNEH